MQVVRVDMEISTRLDMEPALPLLVRRYSTVASLAAHAMNSPVIPLAPSTAFPEIHPSFWQPLTTALRTPTADGATLPSSISTLHIPCLSLSRRSVAVLSLSITEESLARRKVAWGSKWMETPGFCWFSWPTSAGQAMCNSSPSRAQTRAGTKWNAIGDRCGSWRETATCRDKLSLSELSLATAQQWSPWTLPQLTGISAKCLREARHNHITSIEPTTTVYRSSCFAPESRVASRSQIEWFSNLPVKIHEFGLCLYEEAEACVYTRPLLESQYSRLEIGLVQ